MSTRLSWSEFISKGSGSLYESIVCIVQIFDGNDDDEDEKLGDQQTASTCSL